VIWSLADRLGTVRDLVQYNTTTSTTTLVNHIQYDTFGQLTSQTNTSQTPWFGYTGREWDTATGLTYYRARWYDPRAGRFISEDPLSFAAGDVNLNRYVGNGATLWVDPSGMIMYDPSQLPPSRPTPGIGNIVGGALELTAGVAIAGVGVAGEIPSAGLSSIAVIGGTAIAADGLDRIVAGFEELLGGAPRETAAEITAREFGGEPGLEALKHLRRTWEEYALQLGLTMVVGGGPPVPGRPSAASAGAPASTQSTLTSAPQRAHQTVGTGRGPDHGTRVHSAFESEVNALGNTNLSTEVSSLNGRVVPRGTPGSVRLDVVEGPLTGPTAVYDLKTGSATLTPARIQQIQRHIPGGGNVPVIEIR
jgi:RHS repeat-associated protein